MVAMGLHAVIVVPTAIMARVAEVATVADNKAVATYSNVAGTVSLTGRIAALTVAANTGAEAGQRPVTVVNVPGSW